MSKKQDFIDYVNELIAAAGPTVAPAATAKEYWEVFCAKEEVEKPLFTDNGKIILKFLQDHSDTIYWKSRDIAEELFIGAKTVSGAMRKLVTDGFVEKVGQDPISYTLTEKGKNIEIEN